LSIHAGQLGKCHLSVLAGSQVPKKSSHQLIGCTCIPVGHIPDQLIAPLGSHLRKLSDNGILLICAHRLALGPRLQVQCGVATAKQTSLAQKSIALVGQKSFEVEK
jgi:hypothetical protein